MPTLSGRVKLKVPAGTQSGKLFRLRNKGVKSVRSSAMGDLFCKIAVEIPVKLSDEQKTLLNNLEASLAKDGKDHSPRSNKWFAGVKRFFEGVRP